MEQLISVRELFKNTEAYAGKTVSVGGWVRSVRASKDFGFIVLSDGTYFQPVQVVYHDTMENFAEISKTNVGAALIVRGTLTLTPEAKQPFEIQADEVVVEGERIKLPVVLNEHSLLPVKQQQPEISIHSEHAFLPNPARTAQHIGWDADTGLMVFGRWDG